MLASVADMVRYLVEIFDNETVDASDADMERYNVRALPRDTVDASEAEIVLYRVVREVIPTVKVAFA
jgi:hypothetical protein